MEEDIDSVGPLRTGLCGGPWDTGRGRELVCRSRDLESEVEATGVSCQRVRSWNDTNGPRCSYLTVAVMSRIMEPSVAWEMP